MTTEFVLLLGLFAFVTAGAFFGEKGPANVFKTSGPRLGARIEQNISTGRGFKVPNEGLKWFKPPGGAPDGKFK
jgi:hypothetical protein